ncbi:MAG: DnaJ C-terminal domain-containing protein [Aliidongia sp.]
MLRLRGQGMAGLGGGPAGDALIEVNVAPHPAFRRDGNDLVLELPVSLSEAVLGARIEVPTIKGRVHLTIPPNSNTGTRLRLKERGIAGRPSIYRSEDRAAARAGTRAGGVP